MHNDKDIIELKARVAELEAVTEAVHNLLVAGDLLCEHTAVQLLDTVVKNPCYTVKKSG